MDKQDPVPGSSRQIASIISNGLTRFIRNFAQQLFAPSSTSIPDSSQPHPIGRCLILNFIGPESQASFDEQDLARFNAKFAQEMFKAHDFEVCSREYLNTWETHQLLANESNFDHSNFNNFVIYIIANCSFTVRNRITRQEDKNQGDDKVMFGELFHYFRDEICKSLTGKPKLIFIQHIGHPPNTNLDQLGIELPRNFMLFLTTNIYSCPPLPHSYLLQRLFYFLRRYSGVNHLEDILNFAMPDLNYHKLTTILQSTLTEFVFFNRNTPLNYNNLRRHWDTMRKLSSDQRPIRKFILVDYQNCAQDKLDGIMNKFKKLHFQLCHFRNLNLAQIRVVLREESKIIKYEGNRVYSTVVFCVFANCKNQGFTCEGNELMGLREIFGSILESDEKLDLAEAFSRPEYHRPLKPIENATSTFFIINDNHLNTKDVAPFCFISSASNAYLSMNSYPTMNNLNPEGTELQNVILSLSTNDSSEKVSNDETKVNLLVQITIKKGKCIVLSFNLLECQLREGENIAQDVLLLEDTFGQLGFHMESYKDFTVTQLAALIKQESTNEYNSDQCLIFCLITHFENGWFHCKDKQVNLKSMLNQMHKSSQALSDLTKVIVIKNPYERRQLQQENQNFHSIGMEQFHYILPDQIDIPDNFIILNCSFSNKSNCALISILCQTLNEYFYKHDLMTIMRLMTLRLSEMYQNVYLKSTAKKILFFEIENKPMPAPVKRAFKCFPTNGEIKLLVNGNELFYGKGKGKCLIINCQNSEELSDSNFENNSQVSEQQIAFLRQRFEKLKFDVEVQTDLLETILEIESSRNYDENQYDSLVVFIFSNGAEMKTTTREDLLGYFSKNATLWGKPKVFFMPEQLFINKIDADSHRQIYRIPTYADFLLYHTDHMSSSIDKLCHLIDTDASKVDLMTMLTNIMQHIQSSNSTQTNIPYIHSTMTKLVSLDNSTDTTELVFDNSAFAQTLEWKNRGICFIFNYKDFKNEPNMVRNGTEKDVESLERTFERLNFNVRKFHNLTKQETLHELDLISRANYKSFNCFVFCFLSHGHDKGVLSCHDGDIYRSDVLVCLNANQTLTDTPKLLFIQSCQGEEEDEGVPITEESDSNGVAQLDHYPNIFIFSSCFPGYVSYRDQTQGSWFIQSLCHIISLYKSQFDISTIAAKVSRMVGYEKQSRKQIPFLYSTITRPIKLAEQNE